VVEGDGALVMAEGRVRARRAAGAGARFVFVPVSDLLVLAAIERAECHERVEGVQWGHIPMHLGLEPKASTTVKLRPQVDALIGAGEVRQSRRGGCKVWGLTDAGRGRLEAARRAGEALELPEAPQHREWREARAMAEGEIEWLRDQLRRVLERAQGALLGKRPYETNWLDHGERVRERSAQLAAAYYCLHEWLEPDDTQPDRRALRGWSRLLVREAVGPGEGNSRMLLPARLQLVDGATSD
jgi:hypothetical protein